MYRDVLLGGLDEEEHVVEVEEPLGRLELAEFAGDGGEERLDDRGRDRDGRRGDLGEGTVGRG